MFDVITFGSATWDAFMKIKSIHQVKSKKFISQKGICFNLGSKIDVDNIFFSSGGGGTNTATTFVQQGFKTAFVGAVGQDVAGQEILRELKEMGVDIGFVFKTEKRPTNYSVIFGTGEDRTVLAYRGASELLENIPFLELRAKWFYLAPLSGKLSGITKEIVDFASKNNIKIAFNPGNSQLNLPKKVLEDIIVKVNVLILNQEEASILTGIPYNEEKSIFKKIDEICPGIAIMTKGPEGAVISDGKHIFEAKPPQIGIKDRTGAGDAFGSGFVAGFIKSSGSVEEGIQLGMANSLSCIRKWGAKAGILKKADKFEKIAIKKEICLGNNCKVK